MKKLPLFLSLCALSAACTRNLCTEPASDQPSQVPIHFTAADPLQASVQTRAVTAVTTANLASFYAAATTGTAGSETSAWTSTAFNDADKDGTFNSSDKYWPIQDPSYHFYASNVALSFDAGGSTCTASNTTDVVCAYLPAPTFQASNELTFEHIFARLGSVTVTADSGYTLSSITIKLTPKVQGVYNLRTGAGKNDGTGWQNCTDATSASTISKKVGATGNDIYTVPGSYTVTATWTATKGAYTETFSNKTLSVNLLGGKTNTLNITLGGHAQPISFTVSVTPWGSNTINATLPTS